MAFGVPSSQELPLPRLSVRLTASTPRPALSTHESIAQQAQWLFITTKTASNHVSNILTKLGAPNRRQAAAIAAQHALV